MKSHCLKQWWYIFNYQMYSRKNRTFLVLAVTKFRPHDVSYFAKSTQSFYPVRNPKITFCGDQSTVDRRNFANEWAAVYYWTASYFCISSLLCSMFNPYLDRMHNVFTLLSGNWSMGYWVFDRNFIVMHVIPWYMFLIIYWLVFGILVNYLLDAPSYQILYNSLKAGYW